MEQQLYSVPEGWRFTKLGDLFEITSSKRVHKKDWKTDGVPFYRAREIVELSKRGSVDNELFIDQEMYEQFAAKFGAPAENDILITGVGTVGVCYVVRKGDGFYFKDGNIIWLKRKADIDPRFIEYAFKSEFVARQVHSATGAVVKTYTIVRAKHTVVPICPANEQKRIVAKLDALFTRINAAITHLQESLKLSKALFASALSRGFRSKDRSWKEVKFADVCEISSKLTDPREPEWTDMIHVGGANIESLTGELTELKTVREEKLISGKYPFNQRMVLYSKIRPYLMKVARPSFEGLCSADIYPLSPSPEVLNRDFLFYLLLTEHFTTYANQGSSRAGMPKVNRRHLFDYRFQLPPIAEQSQIAFQLDSLAERTRTLEAETQERLDQLTALKSSLLDAAFRGQL